MKMGIRSLNQQIQEVLAKYLEEEKKIDAKILECEVQRKKMESCAYLEETREEKRRLYVKNDAAIERNQQLLSDLELSRARWRTLTSFTPTDHELAERVVIYRQFLVNI